MSSIWTFLLIWGVWLITPILVDGVEAVARLYIVKTRRLDRGRRRRLEDWELPTLSVIVPAHNEAEVIDRCLNSLKAQDYPHDKLEIIVVDDGSTDGTADRVEVHLNGGAPEGDASGSGFRVRGKPIRVGPFNGTLELIKNGHQGKAHALNAGIEAATGEIIINIDSDVVLAPDAVRNTAAAFARNPELAAATGNIEIDWDIIEARDEVGQIVLDEDGHIVPRKLGPIERYLAKSQFLEYLSSFDLGRRSQAITGTMYTLAGAYSAFRRETLAGCSYNNSTVSEDTCLTFEFHRKGAQVGFVDNAKAYLEPVVEWDGLYAQRVRWARGQLEVCGLNQDVVGSRQFGKFGRFALPKMLLLDHTLAFPRLIWAPLLMFFPMIGYSWRIIALAGVALVAFYLILEIVNALAVHAIADDHTKARMEKCGWALLGLPVYRFIVFHFRFSGFLVTLTEKQQWTMNGPMQTTRSDLRTLRLRSIELVTGTFVVLAASFLRVARFAATVLAPLLFSFVIVLRWIDSMRRNG
ncbi:MAG: glycosyltransferase [Coriobacteriia bacterium]|nr:glycosyltransferase [Coriobacteriia bacterium]